MTTSENTLEGWEISVTHEILPQQLVILGDPLFIRSIVTILVKMGFSEMFHLLLFGAGRNGEGF